MTEPSAACCKGKPIHMHGPDSKLQGEFKEFDGLRTCLSISLLSSTIPFSQTLDVVGPATASSAVLVIYDIFGFWTQTLHGVDTLSRTATASSPTGLKLFVPDWFAGDAADISCWPADTDAKWAYIRRYFQTQADPGKTLKRMQSVLDAISSDHDAIENWGIAGYCWGGKVRFPGGGGGDRS